MSFTDNSNNNYYFKKQITGEPKWFKIFLIHFVV